METLRDRPFIFPMLTMASNEIFILLLGALRLSFYQIASLYRTPQVYRPLTLLWSQLLTTAITPSLLTLAVNLAHSKSPSRVTQLPKDTLFSSPISLTPSPAQLSAFQTSLSHTTAHQLYCFLHHSIRTLHTTSSSSRPCLSTIPTPTTFWVLC